MRQCRSCSNLSYLTSVNFVIDQLDEEDTIRIKESPLHAIRAVHKIPKKQREQFLKESFNVNIAMLFSLISTQLC